MVMVSGHWRSRPPSFGKAYGLCRTTAKLTDRSSPVTSNLISAQFVPFPIWSLLHHHLVAFKENPLWMSISLCYNKVNI